MNKERLEILKEEIETKREELYRYIEYPEIFRVEIRQVSNEIDEYINEYMKIYNEK